MLPFPKKALDHAEDIDDFLSFNYVRNLIMAGHEVRMITVNYGDHTHDLEEFLVRVKKIFPGSKFFSLPSRWTLLVDDKVMLTTSNDYRSFSLERNSGEISFWFRITGEKQAVEAMAAAVREEFKSFRIVKKTVEWKYLNNDGRVASRSMPLTKVNPCFPELYPWIAKTPDVFIEEYLKSEASTLLILGPPGTGKTSFIRHILCHFNLSGVLTYDPEILTHDSFYLDFVGSDKDVLIIEDADELLLSRKVEDNRNMKRFLNVGDGVVRFARKKIVFTTNLNFDDVDAALTRQGRCFAVLKSRLLTKEEAAIAAQVHGLTLPAGLERDISLAEIFNPGVDVSVPERVGAGFMARVAS